MSGVMGRPPKKTAPQIIAMCQQVAAGEKVRVVAARNGISSNTLCKHLHERGYKLLPTKPRRWARPTNERKDQCT